MRHTGLLLLLVLLLGLTCDANAGFEQGERAFHEGDFERAVEELRGPAKEGDPAAQYLLGRILLTRTDMAGVEWIRKSAAARQLSAELDLAMMQLVGLYEPVDVPKAMAILERAVGHTPREGAANRHAAACAQYLLGWLTLQMDKSDAWAQAVQRVHRAADAGLDDAQALYARILGQGLGAPVDLVEAQKYYLLFVKQKDAAEAFRLGLGSFEGSLTEEQVAKANTHVAAWLKARDAGSLGWVYEHDTQLSTGQNALRLWDRVTRNTFRYLDREARTPDCAPGVQWLRERTRVKLWTPDATEWVERWTIDACGAKREFLVDLQRYDRGFHWKVRGPAGEGAPSPQQLLEQTYISVSDNDLETLPKLVAPDERPFLNLWLMEVVLTVRGHCLMGGGKELEERGEKLLTAVSTALERHGLSLEALETPRPQRTIDNAPAIAAWWDKLAPELDHTAFLIDVMYDFAEIDRGVPLALTRPTKLFETYCGDVTALEIEDDVAIAVIRNYEVKMRKIQDRWYLSLAGLPQPARYRPPGGGVGAASTVPAHESAFERGELAYEMGDYEAARSAWTPLAEQGGREAQLRLGALYENGQGVEKDLASAHLWYRLASDRRSPEAHSRMDMVREQMSTPQIEAAQTYFDAWHARAKERRGAETRYPLFPIVEKSQWGFIDLTGRVVIPPRYAEVYHPGLHGRVEDGPDATWVLRERIESDVWPTTYEMIAVRQADRWGYAGREGLGVSPTYDRVAYFSEGLGFVRRGTTGAFIDAHGLTVIPLPHGGATWFEDGAAAAGVDGKWGLIDRKGAFVIQPTYDTMRPGSVFLDAPGLWQISLGDKYGIARSDGRILLEPRFDGVSAISEGLVRVRSEGKWGYVDGETGRFAISPTFDSARKFKGGFAAVSTEGGDAIIDRMGRLVFGPIPDADIRDFHGPLKIFDEGLLEGIVDARTGTVVVEPKYRRISSVSDGRACIRTADDWSGYLDAQGAVAITPRFTSVHDFSEGLAAAAVDGRPLGYLDRTGAWVIKPHLEEAGPFREGLALVVDQNGKRYRYLNREGQTVYSFDRPGRP